MIAGWWGISGDLVVCQKSSHHQDSSIFGLGDPELYLELSPFSGKGSIPKHNRFDYWSVSLEPKWGPLFWLKFLHEESRTRWDISRCLSPPLVDNSIRKAPNTNQHYLTEPLKSAESHQQILYRKPTLLQKTLDFCPEWRKTTLTLRLFNFFVQATLEFSHVGTNGEMTFGFHHRRWLWRFITISRFLEIQGGPLPLHPRAHPWKWTAGS